MSPSKKTDRVSGPTTKVVNERKLRALVARLGGTGNSTVPSGPVEGFAYLSAPVSPIAPLDMRGLGAQLGRAGRKLSLLVHIKEESVDERPPLGPTSTLDEIVDRCCRFWPLAKRWWEEYENNLPDTVVATMGPPDARLIIGAWQVAGDESCLWTGDWQIQSHSSVPGFAGEVLDPSIHFPRARHGTFLIASDGTSVSSSAQILRDSKPR